MYSRPPIDRLCIDAPMATPEPDLAAEFPTVRIVPGRAAADGAVVDDEAWRRGSSFRAFDEVVERSSSSTLVVSGTHAASTATEVLTRFQRFVARRNEASRAPEFDRVLVEHRALHDCNKPLVKADLDHALDVWQWTLRLAPGASLAVQLAALFHDVERLESEADARIEHRAPDYQAFKDAHARRGADLAYEVLVRAGIDARTAERTREIVASHERRGVDPDVDLLNDADGLSFFSLNSAGYADYFGPAQTHKKIEYTLSRLGGTARMRLSRVRLREDLRRMLVEAMSR